MIIIGIDPGLATTGFGVIKKEGSSHKLIAYGAIKTLAKINLAIRLDQIYKDIQHIINKYSPDVAAVEDLFFNVNVSSALQVGHARGVSLLSLTQAGLSVSSYTPPQVKMAICGYGHAQKNQVQYMVQKLLGLDFIPKPVDAADALAIAICHSHYVKINSIS
jgi:crossover junction endodeoxyribonuclease RuvC